MDEGSRLRGHEGYEVCSDDGAALVSTGTVRPDKRAEVPILHKPGNFVKIN